MDEVTAGSFTAGCSATAGCTASATVTCCNTDNCNAALFLFILYEYIVINFFYLNPQGNTKVSSCYVRNPKL